jgi:hypothetical protein
MRVNTRSGVITAPCQHIHLSACRAGYQKNGKQPLLHKRSPLRRSVPRLMLIRAFILRPGRGQVQDFFRQRPRSADVPVTVCYRSHKPDLFRAVPVSIAGEKGQSKYSRFSFEGTFNVFLKIHLMSGIIIWSGAGLFHVENLRRFRPPRINLV